MKYLVLLILLLVILLGFLVRWRLKERLYLKKKLSQALDPQFYQEITGEEQEIKRRQQKFEDSLRKHFPR